MNSTRVFEPAQIMIGMYMQRWHSAAILQAASLGIADELATTSRHVRDLASSVGVDAGALLRLLRALASRGVFRQTAPGEFANTDLSRALMSGAAGGAKELIQSLSYTSGGVDRFAMRAARSDSAITYHQAMTALAVSQADAILDAVDFAAFKTVADLGGGQGALLARILERNPGQRGMLVDYPEVLEGSPPLLARAGVSDRCKLEPGDVRETIPAGCDAYILKNVLHGYSDADCENILRGVSAVLRPGARLFVIELIMPEGSAPAAHVAFDLFLLSGGEGRVRSEAEFVSLLDKAGLQKIRVATTDRLIGVLEAGLQ